MTIRPFGNQILIQPTEKKQVLVADQGTLCEYGKVTAIGDEVMKVKVGDTLGFLVWGISKLVIEDDTFYFVKESDDFILGFLEDGLETKQV